MWLLDSSAVAPIPIPHHSPAAPTLNNLLLEGVTSREIEKQWRQET